MKSSLLRELAVAMAGQPILVLGDVMLDEYIWGEVRRISPEAPVPVVEVQRRSHVPGGAANSAANVASLGGRAFLGGVVGDDPQAAILTESLQALHVDSRGLVVDRDRPTTTKTRIIAHIQQIVRVDAERRHPLSAEAESRLLAWVASRLPEVRACLLSDYAKGVLSAGVTSRLVQLARAAGCPVIVDPKGADYTKYHGATLVKPNVHEAERLTKHEIHNDTDLFAVGRQLLDMLPGTSVLITRGAQGMTLFQPERGPLHIHSVARTVYDVTGAGDTVASALTLALAAGANLEQAAALANRAAGIVVAKVGTTALKLDELLTDLGGDLKVAQAA